MKIELQTSPKKRLGYRYDPKRNEYVTYKISGQIGGKRYRQGGFPSRKAAQDFIDETRLAQKYRRAGVKLLNKSPRLSELFEARLGKIPNKAERVRGERIFGIFRSLLRTDPKVTDVTSGDVHLFINARNNEVKPETVNRELNLIAKALRSAPELFPKELEDFEPPKIPRPKFKRKRREKTISPKEKDAILANLYSPQNNETDAEYQNRIRIGRMFELAWFLGMAYKEVATLKTSSYNGTSLEFLRHKTGANVKFEWLPDRVHELLQSAINDSECDFVFTHSGSTPKNFYTIMKEAVESAGLVYGRDKGITFHSARHSFVTTATRHGDLKTVGSMTGHTDDTMVLLYTHASPESRKRVLQSMYSTIDLRDIFDRVRSGQMTFDEFEKAVR